MPYLPGRHMETYPTSLPPRVLRAVFGESTVTESQELSGL